MVKCEGVDNPQPNTKIAKKTYGEGSTTSSESYIP
jgi:hypothetical protein